MNTALLKKLINYPRYLLDVFSKKSNFVSHPVLGSKILNRFGLHVFRYSLAHLLTQFRWLLLSPLVSPELRKEFKQNGFIKIDDFFSPREFIQLKENLSQLEAEPRQCVQGDTKTQRIVLTPELLHTKLQLNNLLNQSRLNRLFRYTAANNQKPLLYFQIIKNGFVQSEEASFKKDPQKNLHSDTFHPTMKAWLFLEDVPAEKGPFTYVPSSQRWTLKRLKWEYQQSINYHRKDGYSQRGSLRIDKNDRQQMQLNAPQALCVKANTLVIANTHGFHGRGQAEQNASRMEIWAFSRSNPFLPFVSFPSELYNRLQYKVLKKQREKADKQAQASGKRASWHKISRKEFYEGIDL